MPVFRLTERLTFPPTDYAEPDGLLAVGGDLRPERLLLAYRLGIFPWYSEETPILWWSPDPRLVLYPSELKVAKSLRRVIKKGAMPVTFDRAFPEVIRRCATVRRAQGEGTWLVPAMIRAYTQLHRLGYAHSVESWFEGELVGGLYGVALGQTFFGESMFAERTDASKVAFVQLVERLKGWGYTLIDCQVTTAHLQRFGAREIPRREFLAQLENTVCEGNPRGSWDTGQTEIHT